MATDSQRRISAVRHKIEWAKKHVVDLDAAVSAFCESSPYEVAIKRDPQTRRPIHYVSKVADIPVEIALIAGDAIQNLRSSLDYLARALVEANSQVPTRKTAFPICGTAKDYAAPDAIAKKHGMSAAAENLIDAAKPYKGGNDDFWVLNELNNIAKHRLIITVGSALRGIDLAGYMNRRMLPSLPPEFRSASALMEMFYAPTDNLCPLKAGDELFSDVPDAEPDKDLKFRFEIAIGEPEVATGQSLLETVQKCVQLVDGIFVQLEPLL